MWVSVAYNRAACLVALLTSLSGMTQASVPGFEDRYFSKVDDETWSLHLESSSTFASLASIKLQMGNARDRYILTGNVEGTQITGSYKRFLSAALMAEDRPFVLKRVSDKELLLTMKQLPSFPAKGVRFLADDNVAAVDNALVGMWASEPKLGVSADNPYMGEQWRVHFRADGSLCETVVMADKRRPPGLDDPCDSVNSVAWKSEEGKVLLQDRSGNWDHAFTYRLMGGRLVASYPGGKRLIANPIDRASNAGL